MRPFPSPPAPSAPLAGRRPSFPSQKAVIGVLLLGGALFAAQTLLWFFGFFWNLSSSLPLGLWRLDAALVPQKGCTVLVCLPREIAAQTPVRITGAGFCPMGRGLLMKEIAGVAFDRVVFRPEGIVLNGIVLAKTQRFFDFPMVQGTGKTLGQGEILLSKEEFLLVGHQERSFDGRYFGPLPRSAILGVLVPVWTFSWPLF